MNTDPFDGNKCSDEKCEPNKNPKNKAGFQELGSDTPMDLALRNNHSDIVEFITATLQKEEKNQTCDFLCPQSKTNTEMPTQCYQPDLMQGMFLV